LCIFCNVILFVSSAKVIPFFGFAIDLEKYVTTKPLYQWRQKATRTDYQKDWKSYARVCQWIIGCENCLKWLYDFFYPSHVIKWQIQ